MLSARRLLFLDRIRAEWLPGGEQVPGATQLACLSFTQECREPHVFSRSTVIFGKANELHGSYRYPPLT